MKAAILGGTFNPIHVGHLFVADVARRLHGYDRVFLVPSNIPAHKEIAAGVSSAHRLRMVRLAARGKAGLIVDDCELRRGGISYTIDTVQYLLDRYDIQERPGLLIGDDLIDGFSSWRRADQLSHRVDIVVFHRVSDRRLDFSFPHTYLDNSLLQVSSTDIRDRVRRGETIRSLVPESVRRYIARNRLYHDDQGNT